jgi:hypothetical protein
MLVAGQSARSLGVRVYRSQCVPHGPPPIPRPAAADLPVVGRHVAAGTQVFPRLNVAHCSQASSSLGHSRRATGQHHARRLEAVGLVVPLGDCQHFSDGRERQAPLARGGRWSRLGESNPGPTHYEGHLVMLSLRQTGA